MQEPRDHEMERPRLLRSSARHSVRYVPFLILAIAQAALVLATPPIGQRTGGEAGSPGAGAGSFVGASGEGAAFDGSSSVEGASTATGGGTSGAGASRSAATGGAAAGARGATSGAGARSGGATSGAGATQAASAAAGAIPMGGKIPGLDPREQGLWPWSRPWELNGDRSRCAPGGQTQDDVMFVRTPCLPRYKADNGGVTWRGVTATEVKVVFYLGHRTQAGQSFLTAALQQSEEQEDQHIVAWEAWLNKHFEFYGRKLKTVIVRGECGAIDCMRNEARTIVQKHQPFACMCYGGTLDFIDELTRHGVWATHTAQGGLEPKHYIDHRPFRFDFFADGRFANELAAEYWCKKMYNKDATLAGDPTMRTQRRKLGIINFDDPARNPTTEHLVGLVTGGACGSGDAKDQPVVFRMQAGDQTRLQEQSRAVAATFKQEGVTTVYSITFGGSLVLAAFSGQNYFPEHLIGMANFDHDLLGRTFQADQWRNAFGFGPLWIHPPNEQEDFTRAAREMNPTFNFQCSGCVAHWESHQMLAFQLQWAGPNLTPHAMERGALEAPQLAGYRWNADETTPTPWPGWKCCNPMTVKWKFGGPEAGRYTANKDARHVYWDGSARSTYDNGPGAYVCVEGPECPRFDRGGWSVGEPKAADANWKR